MGINNIHHTIKSLGFTLIDQDYHLGQYSYQSERFKLQVSKIRSSNKNSYTLKQITGEYLTSSTVFTDIRKYLGSK